MLNKLVITSHLRNQVEKYGMQRVENLIVLKMYYLNMFLKENAKKFEEFFLDHQQRA